MILVVQTVTPAVMLPPVQLVLLLGLLAQELALRVVQLEPSVVIQQEIARVAFLTVTPVRIPLLAANAPALGSMTQPQLLNAHKPVLPPSSEIQQQEPARTALQTVIPVQVEVSVPLVHQPGTCIKALVLKIVQQQLLLTHQ